MLTSLEELYEYAISFYGIPYEWGGEGKTRDGGYGFDCSGLVQAILSKVGADFPGDQTSNEMYLKLKEVGTPGCRLGALAFFSVGEVASHVGFMLDKRLMISAAGGGSGVVSEVIAKQRNACVRIQPVTFYRFPQFIGAFSPKYDFLKL